MTGAKNARLICIKDDDSLTEPEPPATSLPKLSSKHSSETDNLHNGDSRRNLDGNGDKDVRLKVSRLPRKKFRKLEMLPKEYALGVLQYKLEFQNAKRENPMYKKSAMIKPWNLVEM